MYRPFGEMTSEFLEEGTYFAPGINPEKIFRSDNYAGRCSMKRMLVVSLVIDLVAILALVLFSIIR